MGGYGYPLGKRIIKKDAPRRFFFFYNKKIARLLTDDFFCIVKRLFATLLGKTLTAVHRAVFTGLEGNFRFLAAVRTHSGEHFASRSACVLARVAASFAALGLVYKALFSIEFLLTGGEHKFISAFFADQSLVFVHWI